MAIAGADSFRDDLWVLMQPNESGRKGPSPAKLESYRASYSYLTGQMEWMEEQLKLLKKR